MKILGSIVSKRKIKDVASFVEVVNDIGDVNDPTNPILVVGYNEAKSMKDNFSILEHELDEGVYWTYGKTEKRDVYERHLKMFYEEVINHAIKDIQYYFVNLFKLRYSEAKNLIGIMKNNGKKYIYIDSNMIYVYYDNYVLGISLEITDWIGIDREKLIGFIKSNENSSIRFSDSFLDFGVKKIISNKKYVTPYFISTFN